MDIPETSPEHILYAAECAVMRDGALPIEVVADYLNTPEDHARRALEGALLLGMIAENEEDGEHYETHPLAELLLSANLKGRQLIFRIFLDRFDPFSTYKRKVATGTLSAMAARHVRVAYDIDLSSTLLEETFQDWGAFAGTIRNTDEGPAVVASEVGLEQFSDAITDALDDEEGATTWVEAAIEPGFAARVPEQVIRRLATGVLRCARQEEPRAAAQPVGIAVEDYLRFYAEREGLDHTGCTGTGSLLGLLSDEDALPRKQQGLGDALNQVRIACEHGEDRDAGMEWHVGLATVDVMVRLAIRFIRSCELYYDGDLVL